MQPLGRLALLLSSLFPLESCQGLFYSPKERDQGKATTTDYHNTEQVLPQPHVLTYGVDVSFPIHHSEISTNFDYLPHNVDETIPTPDKYVDMPVSPFGMDRVQFYEHFLKGCMVHVGPEEAVRCQENEAERIDMALLQPQSMKNFTTLGFHKIRAPDQLFRLVSGLWNRSQDKITDEEWPIGNTYTNNWEAPSKVLSIEQFTLRSGKALKQELWEQAEPVVSKWVGQKLKPSSLYGIRIYTAGAILATHVDRIPLVSSAIVNVAQDVDEPWPLEVISHDGVAYNVTMLPGDMVLYESHSLLHGRPFPLKGRYVANVFIHFEPTGPLAEGGEEAADPHNNNQSSGAAADTAQSQTIDGASESTQHLPSYILPGSPAAIHWQEAIEESEGDYEDYETHVYDDSVPGEKDSTTARQVGGQHIPDPTGTKAASSANESSSASTSGSKSKVVQRSPTSAHRAARHGSLEDLEAEILREHTVVNATDENGWTPLHSGAHGGHVEVVKLLIAAGADMDAKTWYGSGGTALWWAKQFHGKDHPVVEFLESIGAEDVGPEL